jgi:DNA-directed RNA polymerase specialized sigma24 family protein
MIKLAEKYGDKPAAELPMLFQRILQNTILDYFRREKVRNTWVSLFSGLGKRAKTTTRTLIYSNRMRRRKARPRRVERGQVERAANTRPDRCRRDTKAAGASTGSLPHALLAGHGRG